MNKWYAYVHINMTLHVKRFWNDDWGDIREARDSDFVLHVFEPYYAENRKDAIEKINPEYMQFMKKYQEM